MVYYPKVAAFFNDVIPTTFGSATRSNRQMQKLNLFTPLFAFLRCSLGYCHFIIFDDKTRVIFMHLAPGSKNVCVCKCFNGGIR